MDVAFNQHSPHARRANRSTTNLNHLSLAPLTSKLPLNDPHQLPSPTEHLVPTSYTSYLEGKSAPTTPGILSRNSSHTNLNATLKKKSKSSTHLLRALKTPPHAGASKSGPSTPRRRYKDELSLTATLADGGNSDWLERAGALITTQTQESRGQSWLTSRASSTSLTGIHNREIEEEEEFERQLIREREREMNRHSRRNSDGTIRSAYGDGFVADDEFSPITTRMSFGSRFGSRQNSRMGSRMGSRRASKAGMIAITPLIKEWGENMEYFDGPGDGNEIAIAEADFVDPEEDAEDTMYAGADEEEGDEMLVRRLAKRGNFGVQMFVEKLLGFNLFALEEEEGEFDEEDEGDAIDEEKMQLKRQEAQRRYFENAAAELERVPAPAEGEVGSWADAAWLLSVASKVLL